MHKEIKQSADNGDFASVKINFRFAFDIDPSFDSYREDYQYCKNIPGLFEEHRELTPFQNNPSFWNENYWDSLKNDLSENFSVKRFDHILEVAKVYHRDKIQKLEAEKAAKLAQKTVQPAVEPIPTRKADVPQKPVETAAPQKSIDTSACVKTPSQTPVQQARPPIHLGGADTYGMHSKPQYTGSSGSKSMGNTYSQYTNKRVESVSTGVYVDSRGNPIGNQGQGSKKSPKRNGIVAAVVIGAVVIAAVVIIVIAVT